MIDELRRSAAHVFVDDLAHPALGDADQHHLTKVLRLRTGEAVSCSDGRGSWRMCAWSGEGVVVAGEIETLPVRAEHLALALSPVKGDGTDEAVTKLVEIGIDEIVVLAPVDHSVVRWDQARAATHMERLARLVRAASMQSRRVFLPAVTGPVALDDVLAREGAALAEPGGDEIADSTLTCIVVGPEGGFSAAEVARAPRTVSLGGGILRADTAAVAAAVRLCALFGR